MISLESATWVSPAVTPPAPAAAGSTADRERRRRPAMVVRRPASRGPVEVGPADPLHPAGRVDIYL